MRPPNFASYAHLLALPLLAIPFALAASCERIAFYSTGRPSPASASAVSGTTAGAASSGGSSTQTRAAVLEAIASCTAELLDNFRTAAEEFDAAAAASATDPSALDATRTAWAKAIGIWQQAELFQFGPAGPTTTPGGQSLRDQIYSWPLVSRCLVDEHLVSKAYEDPSFGTAVLINTRGLAAAEYLLFYAGTDNGCSPATPINAMGQWAALDTTELAARKAHYASAVAAGVANRARQLVTAWSPDGGDFRSQLAGAGQAGSAYASDQMAFNAITDAMFYIEIATKDLKLGRPLGLIDCEDTTCPLALESRYAGRSKQHIRNNLLGLRMLMAGCHDGEGLGFDDLLVSAGAEPFAEKLTSAVDAAIAAVDTIAAEDLAQALEADVGSVQKLHATVKAITDLLKTDFVSVLDLELPKQVEGDND